MAFDYDNYNSIKEFVELCIFEYNQPASVYAEMVPRLIDEEDYEGAKAVRDVLVMWMQLHCNPEEMIEINKLVGIE